ncbi:hypothetical protein D5b_00181 [Faustovirus]|nr:hypothetical protein D5b_00181 [Faustovirus]AMN84732.1 hypothetical protein D6_00330 [Faustovirus]AMP44136.1 hypothetical protein PRJ_Dakar_00179 [Faustovirus]
MATTRVEYPLSGICLYYRREYVGAIPKYTLTKSLRMPNGGTKKIKVNPITQQEWNAVNIGL